MRPTQVRGFAVWFYAWAERESYDVAPLNPKPEPTEADSLVEELGGATLDDDIDERGSILVNEDEMERSADLVKQWQEAVVDGEDPETVDADGRTLDDDGEMVAGVSDVDVEPEDSARPEHLAHV